MKNVKYLLGFNKEQHMLRIRAYLLLHLFNYNFEYFYQYVFIIGSSYDEFIDTKLIALISGGVNLSTSLVTAIYKKINMGVL